MPPLCSAARVQDGILPPSQASLYELSGVVGPRQIPRQLARRSDLQRQRVEQVTHSGDVILLFGTQTLPDVSVFVCFGSKHQDKNGVFQTFKSSVQTVLIFPFQSGSDSV